MKHLLSPILALTLAISGPVVAQQNPVVVELFTSQGCASCPPADEILKELADREDVIALALHVDYWDYIGWADPFGDPAHADRQRAYAIAAGRKSIYTPEMIVQGQTDIVGTKPMKLSEAIAAHAKRAAPARLSLSREGDQLRITGEMMTEVKGPMTLHMLRYEPHHQTEIKRGENSGMTLDYANIVQNWQVLGSWNGTAPLKMDVPLSGEAPVVVILQQAKAGPILAAARIK